MASPFTVQPVNLQGLGQVAQAWGQNRQQEQQKEQQLAKQQEIKGIIDRNDINEMSQYMAANPQYASVVEKAFGFKNDATKKNAIDTAFSVLSGDDSDQALQARVDFITEQGGNPSLAASLLNRPPEEREKYARIAIANLAPEKAKALSEMSGGSVENEIKVGKQEILEDGTTIQSTPRGVVVYNPQGELVKGSKGRRCH